MVKAKLSCMDFVNPSLQLERPRHEADGDCGGDFSLQLIDVN